MRERPDRTEEDDAAGGKGSPVCGTRRPTPSRPGPPSPSLVSALVVASPLVSARAWFQVTPGGTLVPNLITLYLITLSIGARGHPSLADLDEQLLVQVEPSQGRIVGRLADEIIKRNVNARVGVDEMA